MSDTTLAKTYNAAEVEREIAELWKAHRDFHAEPHDPDAGDPYVVVIPPPNVTAALHLGHALNNTLQDVLVRWRRMCGDNAVWIPGTDHAGIATQTVVDKRLRAEGEPALAEHREMEACGAGGREKFVEKVQAWKDEYEQRITEQLRAMGCSCDFERQAFTMDDVRARAVREAFFRLFRDGLIYRGKRLVNWDPATQTALADDEVEMEEIDGHFWYLKYPVVEPTGDAGGAQTSGFKETGEYVTVATTRPETMLGDTAVAVNPNDAKRAGYIGRHVRLPLVNRVVPIIGDDYVVIPDPESEDARARMASGFLKVTPAHDPNDYEIGQRHDLPLINVMAPDGTISKDHGWPAHEWDTSRGRQPAEAPDDRAGPAHDAELENILGMDRYEAREAVVEFFRRHDLLADVKPHRHSVGHSYRSHVPVEPYLSDQWYVAVTKQIPSLPAENAWPGTDISANSLAGLALRAMADEQRTGDPALLSRGQNVRQSWESGLTFIPDRYARTFQHWHENLRDWCISRQLWWGHRIPVRKLKFDPKPQGNERSPYVVDDTGSGSPQIAFNDEWLGRVSQALGDYGLACDLGERAFALQPLAREASAFVCPRTDAADDALEALKRYVEDQVSPASQEIQDAAVDLINVAGLLQVSERDPDVLDTWFSSALWPMSTLGWPEETDELKAWNPTSTLSTAREIITLWVSRMVMFNLYFRDCLPFRDVFIHAMIQDGEGRKMSKSLGNGVDPLDIIHSHGADAMRFTLTYMTTHTQDVRMPVEPDPKTGRNTSPKFDLGRNFCNKLWNAGRFALQNLEQGVGAAGDVEASMSLADKWIVSRLARTVRAVDEALSNYAFSAYVQACYDFFWRDLCDWYLEAIKPVVRADSAAGAAARATLAAALDAALRLLHPVTPFVTERLWAELNRLAPQRGVRGVDLPASERCIRARWPAVEDAAVDEATERHFERLQEVIGAIRNVRSQYNVPPRRTVEVHCKAPRTLTASLELGRALIATLGGAAVGRIGPEVEPGDQAASAVVGEVQVLIDGLVDPQAERERLEKRQVELEKQRRALEGRLANKGYVEKAPAHLVQQTRDQLAEVEQELATLASNLARLG